MIAAVFIDCDGEVKVVIDLVYRFIIKDFLDPKLQQVTNGIPHHPVSVFHELIASYGCAHVEFKYDDLRAGIGLTDHNESRQNFSCSIKIHGSSICMGKGTNQKIAKKQACLAILGSKNELRRKFTKQLKAMCRCEQNVGQASLLIAKEHSSLILDF